MQEDYTDRVKLHRRELGKRLAEARQNGQYAVMRYDKLIIDNDMYKYDERNEQIVLFGVARARAGMRPLGGRQGETSNTQGIIEKDQADNEDDT